MPALPATAATTGASMLTIEDLKGICLEARASFETVQLIIAGGAPRDILSKAPVKDIDIFVNGAYVPHFEECCGAFAAVIGGVIVNSEAHNQGDKDYVGRFGRLCDIKMPGEHPPVQVIQLFEDPVDDVNRYDFGLSQCFVTPRGLFMTPKCIEDRMSMSITYMDTDKGNAALRRSKRRLAHLRAKYDPDLWLFNNCEQLDAMPEEVTIVNEGSFTDADELMAALDRIFK